MENLYDGSGIFGNASNYINPIVNSSNTNNYSTRRKPQKNYHQLNGQQNMSTQQNQLVKLLENNNINSSNLTSTLPSNSNHTNSNFFASPTLSVKSNRRHEDSLFNSLKYRYKIITFIE